MSARYYDVVVLGLRLGSLAAAALLARRDFRVLVLGNGDQTSTYRYDRVPLRRRVFSHIAAPSPPFRRIIAELAQSQAFKRRLRPLDPMFQVLEPKRRIEVPPDPEIFGRELDREYPVVRPLIEELYANLARLNARVDEVFEHDAVWPPGNFWERRETARLRDKLPLLETPTAGAWGRTSSPLRAPSDELNIDATYRAIVEWPVRFTSDVFVPDQNPVPSLPLARLHGAWTRGVYEIPGDEDELAASLIERIRAHGGDVRVDDRCDGIIHKRERVTGVMLEGDDEPTGCSFVISGRETRRLLDSVRDLDRAEPFRSVSRTARRRFVVSMVVKKSLVPTPLSCHAFLVPERTGGIPVHLHRASFPQSANATSDHQRPGQPGDPILASLNAELWVIEALLDEAWMPPIGATGQDLRARDAVIATVREHFPYLDRHTLMVDSPHDGGPLIDARDGQRRRIPRADLRATGGHIEAEHAEAQFVREQAGYAGLGGEPIRTPIHHLLTVSPAVMPALGSEGEFIAAWGAARIVTRTDRRKEKMRREMWSKIEI